MKQQTLGDALLREFLLGKVNEEERERVENLFLVDPEAKRRILVAEGDLIEDYLENSLTPADRERFLSVYAQTPEQRQSLSIVRSIRQSAARAAGNRSVSYTTKRWSRLRESLRLPLLVPIAVTVAVVIVITVVWLNSRKVQQSLAVEQELAELNTPARLREEPQQMVSLVLSPTTVRGAGHEIELKNRSDVQVVELRLPSFQKLRFSAYEAEVLRLGDDGAFTIRNLQPEDDGRYATRIRLPMHLLRPGQYQVRLIGIPKNGVTEEYQFIVSG